MAVDLPKSFSLVHNLIEPKQDLWCVIPFVHNTPDMLPSDCCTLVSMNDPKHPMIVSPRRS